ncbi:conserved hypothetical protein [Enterobacterales bacterium 8AC]|nr:conserved hypothetical protein [Enterobacterales bacterium 8AC]
MAKQRNGRGKATTDSYENMEARLGLRTPNLSTGGTYQPNWTSRNRLQVENAYRSSWLVGAAVDAMADDMTRKGISITSKMDPHDKQRIDTAWENLALWDALNDTIKWARLYGGAIGVVMIDGQEMETPLRIETVGKGAFKGVMVMDRWMVNPTVQDRETELGPDFGRPRFYQVVTTSTNIPAWKIHHSRVIRFDGVTLPYQQMLTENDWGMSVVERIFDRLLAFDSATTGAAQLVYKAHLRTYSINDLRKILGMGGPAMSALLKHMDMIRQYQSIEGMTLMDASDKFESHTYSFSGLSDVIAQFGEQVSGALGIPLVRLFGQSPAGFSTGDADLANYYDGVGTQQERRLRRPVHKLASIIHMSELGKPIPDDFAFEFNPLWQMSETDRSTVASNTVTALTGAVDSGIMTAYAAAQQLRDSSRVTGIGSTISDEDINNVKGIDPPLPEARRAAETEASGDPIPKPATKDSARGGRRDQWFLRWFK